LLHFHPDALTLGVLERRGSTQRQRDSEQPLHHALMDLSRQIKTLAQAAGLFLLPGGVAGGGDESGGLAERPKEVALSVRELEAAPSAVSADHPVRAPGRAQRR